MRIITSHLTLWVMFGSLFGMAVSLQAEPPKSTKPTKSERPIIRVNRAYYYMKDLFGVTMAEYETAFMREIKKYSIEQMQFYLSEPCVPNSTKLSTETDREILEQKCFEKKLNHDYFQVISYPVGDAILQNILSRHGTKMEDYVDTAPLKEVIRKRIALFEYIEKCIAQGMSDKEIAKNINIKFAPLIRPWQENIVKNIRNRNSNETSIDSIPLFSLREQYMKGDKIKDVYLRGAVLWYFVKKADKKGSVYYKMGEAMTYHKLSALRQITLSGYQGDETVLRDVVRSVMTTDGELAKRGIATLYVMLGELDLGIKLEQASVLGGSNVSKYLSKGLGKLVLTDPGTYRIYGWDRKFVPTNPDPDAMASFIESDATKILYKAYAPDVKVFLENWNGSEQGYRYSLCGLAYDSLQNICIACKEVKIKDYPVEYFNEWELQRSNMQTYAMRTARVILQKDPKAAKELIETLDDCIQKAKTPPVKRKYTQMKDMLKEIPAKNQ